MLRDLVKSKDEKIAELESRIVNLETKDDDHEQYSKRNSLRNSGINETPSEYVVGKVVHLFNTTMKVTPPVTEDQFDRIHRVGPTANGQTRQILVKFATYRVRDRVFRSKRNLANVNKSLTENSVKKEAKKASIFINEDLTKLRSNLLWRARVKKKAEEINECWSWDGTILIKTKANKIVPIRSVSDLERESA